MYIQRLEYFKQFQNWFDMLRIVFIVVSLSMHENFTSGNPDQESARQFVLLTMFCLFWYKLVYAFFPIFRETRYLMQMINETTNDIRSFILILFTTMFAYCHI